MEGEKKTAEKLFHFKSHTVDRRDTRTASKQNAHSVTASVCSRQDSDTRTKKQQRFTLDCCCHWHKFCFTMTNCLLLRNREM